MIFLRVILLLAALASPALALEIRFRDQVQVAGKEITLGDVARITGKDDAARSFEQMQLFEAPKPGDSRNYSAAELARIVQRKARSDEQLLFSGAKMVRIERAGQQLTPAQIEALILQSLSRSDVLPSNSRVSIRSLSLSRPLVLPVGVMETDILPSDPRIIGNTRFSLLVRVDGELVENLSIRAPLEILAPVVVAARDLQRGAVLSKQDLEYREQDISSLRNPVLDLELVEGKVLKRTLRSGAPLEMPQIEFPPLIARGEIVTIRAKRGALEITAQGEARQDGMLGDQIRVRNLSSKKEVLGVVVAPGLVEVEF